MTKNNKELFKELTRAALELEDEFVEVYQSCNQYYRPDYPMAEENILNIKQALVKNYNHQLAKTQIDMFNSFIEYLYFDTSPTLQYEQSDRYGDVKNGLKEQYEQMREGKLKTTMEKIKSLESEYKELTFTRTPPPIMLHIEDFYKHRANKMNLHNPSAEVRGSFVDSLVDSTCQPSKR